MLHKAPKTLLTKLGFLTKFWWFMGILLLSSCDGLQKEADERGATQSTDIDFDKLDKDALNLNLSPSCSLEAHSDPTKRNLECSLLSKDGKNVFSAINAAEILIEYDDGQKVFLPVSLAKSNVAWVLKAEFDVSRIVEIKAMVLGVEQSQDEVEFYEFKFEYDNQIVHLKFDSGQDSEDDKNGHISTPLTPSMAMGKQPLRTSRTKALTLIPTGATQAKILEVTSTGDTNAIKIANDFTKAGEDGKCGEIVEDECQVIFEITAPDFKTYTVDFEILFFNGLGNAKLKLKVDGTGAMIPVKVFGEYNELVRPNGVFFDGSTLYVADTGNGQIDQWSNIEGEENHSESSLNSHSGIHDISLKDSVLHIAQNNFEPCPSMSLENVTGAQNIDFFDDFLVTSSTFCNKVVLKKGSSDAISLSDTEFNAPIGLAYKQNKLYIADSGNHVVKVWSIQNQTYEKLENESIGRPGSPSAFTLNNPSGVALWGNNIFVTDTRNHRILRYSTDNSAQAIEVFGQSSFEASAVPSTPLLTNVNKPTGIHASHGKLFIADSVGNRVLMFNLPEINP